MINSNLCMKSVELKGRKSNVIIGDKSPIVVNCNVGVNDIHNLSYEKDKIDMLFSNIETSPDTIMDLSIFDKQGQLIQYILQNYDVPIGVVPIYSIKHSQLNKSTLLEQIEKYAEMGIAFMTMHFTADTDIFDIAIKERKIPVTSRGGSITLKAAFEHNNRNIFRECLDDIVFLSKKYNFAISLGTTFRPAGITDACDNAHLIETLRQIELSDYLQKQGVSVMVENVGHISLDNIVKHSVLLKKCNAPIMPLGPVVIDSAIGYDHIAAAIGASFMAYNNIAHIINAISPNEHQTSFFSKDDTKNAIIAAKIAAKAVNVIKFTRFKNDEIDIYNIRAKKLSCIITNEYNCERCDCLCPLKMKIYEK